MGLVTLVTDLKWGGINGGGGGCIGRGQRVARPGALPELMDLWLHQPAKGVCMGQALGLGTNCIKRGFAEEECSDLPPPLTRDCGRQPTERGATCTARSPRNAWEQPFFLLRLTCALSVLGHTDRIKLTV